MPKGRTASFLWRKLTSEAVSAFGVNGVLGPMTVPMRRRVRVVRCENDGPAFFLGLSVFWWLECG